MSITLSRTRTGLYGYGASIVDLAYCEGRLVIRAESFPVLKTYKLQLIQTREVVDEIKNMTVEDIFV